MRVGEVVIQRYNSGSKSSKERDLVAGAAVGEYLLLSSGVFGNCPGGQGSRPQLPQGEASLNQVIKMVEYLDNQFPNFLFGND